jgi:hypothetical protein
VVLHADVRHHAPGALGAKHNRSDAAPIREGQVAQEIDYLRMRFQR